MEKYRSRFWEERQVIVCLLFVLIVIGFLLFRNKEYTVLGGNQISDTITIDRSTQLSHKIVGTGGNLDHITYYIRNSNLYEDSYLKVSLLEGTKDNCIQEVILHREQLEGNQLEIEFESIELKFQRDYYIVLSYGDSKNEGSIEFFQTDSKIIAPVYGNNVYYGFSLCYDVVLENSREMFLLRILFVYLGLASAYSIMFNKRFLISVGMVSLLLGITLMAFSFMGILKHTLMIVNLFTVLGWIYSILSIINDKKRVTKEENIQFIWDVGTFLCVVLICFLGNIEKTALNGDVIHHWAFEVKSLFTYDLLPFHPESNVQCDRYPPLYSLYQYLFMYFNGFWSEDILYIAKYVYITTIVISCCCSRKVNTKLEVIFLLILSISLMELVFDGSVIESAYVDEFLGAALGFALISLYRCYVEKENNKLELFLSLCTVGYIKESGIILSGLIILGSIVAAILFGKKEDKKVIILSLIELGGYVLIYSAILWYSYMYIIKSQILSEKKMGIVFLAIILFNILFISTKKKMLTKLSKKEKRTVFIIFTVAILGVLIIVLTILNNLGFLKYVSNLTGISTGKVRDFLKGNGEGYQYHIIYLHVMKLIFGNYFNNNLVNLSFLMFFSIIICIIYFLFHKKSRYFMKIIMFCFSFISFFYILFLHIVYTFMWPGEAMNIPSEARYLGSWLFAVIILLIYIVNSNLYGVDLSKREYFIAISAIVILTNCAGEFRRCIEESDKIYEREEYLKDHAMVVRNHIMPGDKVLYISKDLYAEYLIYSYIIDPGKVEWYVVSEDNYQEEREWLKNQISYYDYIYIRTVPNEYWQEIASTLNNNSEYVEENSLFKIVQNEIIQVY